MSKINYKAVYELAHLDMSPIENVRIKYRQKADTDAQEEYANMAREVAKHVGHDNFYFSNICCVAKGILHHVFIGDPAKNFQERTNGNYRCLFCDCDDWIE